LTYRLIPRSTLQATNGDVLRSSRKYITSQITNMIRRCYSR